MTCETEPFIHFVMTAHDFIKESDAEKEKLKKLDLLNKAMLLLDNAQSAGAPPQTLKELRNLANNKFMEAVNNE